MFNGAAVQTQLLVLIFVVFPDFRVPSSPALTQHLSPDLAPHPSPVPSSALCPSPLQGHLIFPAPGVSCLLVTALFKDQQDFAHLAPVNPTLKQSWNFRFRSTPCFPIFPAFLHCFPIVMAVSSAWEDRAPLEIVSPKQLMCKRSCDS